jgi:hypothetical protein
MTERHFRVVEVSDGIAFEESGRYAGKKPSAAASKAANRIVRNTGVEKFTITIQETTRGSDRRLFSYLMVFEELSEPKVVKRGDTEVEYSRRPRLTRV